MATNDDARDPAGETTTEAARYRRAAEQTLDQVDWCVNYLYRIRKPRIAEAVQKNGSAIRRRMHGPDDESSE
jgi:hypothetical protein